MSRSTQRAVTGLLWALGLALSIWHYWGEGILKMWPANDRLNSYDQVFYVRRAAEIARHGETTRIQRSRMPLYPYLLAPFHEEGKNERELFPKYKWFNAAFSVVVLLGILLVAKWALGTSLAVPLTLSAAFSFIVFKAVLVQPEVLFYFLYFTTFVIMARCLVRPDWRWATLAGGLTALAHLTKASVLPLLAAFVAAAGAQWLWAALRNRRDRSDRLTPAQDEAPLPARLGDWRVPLAALGTYFLLLAPFMWNTHKTFGSPVFDPNTKIYFWAQSADEMDALQQIDLAQQRPAMDAVAMKTPQIRRYLPLWAGDPALVEELERRTAAGERVLLEGKFDILPGAGKYFREHGVTGAINRVWTGTVMVLERNLLHRNGYARHLLVWISTALIVAGLTLAYARSQVASLSRPAVFAIAFVLISIFGNLLLYGFWSYVSNRNRFFLTQFLPILCACGWVIRYLAPLLPWRLSLPPRDDKPGRFQLTACHVVLIILWIWIIDDIWDVDASHRQLPQ